MTIPSLIDTYESLLVDNLSAVRSIESGLRNFTWLLPGRFEDAELASEGLYALLNVVSGYHDSLLTKHLDPSLSLPPHPFISPSADSGEVTSSPNITAPVLPPASDHARYTKYWTEQSTVYRRASRILVTISYVELLVEMVTKKRGGDRRRWRVILGLEWIKTVLRLVILGVTRRPVLSHTTPQREYDLLSLPSHLLKSKSSANSPSTTKPASTSSSALQTSPRPPSAAVTPTLPPYAPLRSHLFPMASALPETHLAHPLTLLPELRGPGQWSAEIIEASLTLIHVVLLLRSARRKPHQSYRHYSLPTLSSHLPPFMIPLLLSLLARNLRRTGTNNSILLSEHHAHLDRRLAARTFLTGPLWVGWTRPKIMGVVRGLERIPIVGLFGEFVEGYLPLVDDYFYYTSS